MIERVLRWLCARLPPRAARRLFGAIAVGLFLLGVRRRVVLENLRLAFPEKPEPERRAIARATYRNLGELIPAFLRLPSIPADELGRIFEYEGWERFEQARAMGKGIIVCTAHFGNFEVLAAAHNLRGVPISIVSRKLNVGLWRRTRLRAGVEDIVVGEGEALSAAVRALRAGRVLGYVIDQSEPSRSAIYPTFFGVPVATAATPAVLSRRTGAPVLFMVSVPLPDGRHRVAIEGPLFPPATGDRARDTLVFLQDLNDRLEAWIRRYPDRWYWLHRRWKRRRDPPGAPRGERTVAIAPLRTPSRA